MVTKEKWLEVRSQQFIPLEVCFEYYKEQGGKVDNIIEFGKIFSDMLTKNAIVPTSSGPKRVSNDSARNRIHQYYNTKFGV